MNLNDIFNELLNENYRNKKVLKTMNDFWFSGEENKINLTSDLLTKFDQIKPRLSVKSPEFKTFLNIHKKFDVSNINDVTKYTRYEIRDLLLQYFEEEPEEVKKVKPKYNPIFSDKERNQKSDVLVEESKKLWFSEDSDLLVFKDKGVRIYKMSSKEDSVNYGHFLKYVLNNHKYKYKGFQWCVTSDNSSNQWKNYRTPNGYRSGRSFFFVIDDKKSPENGEKNNFYLSALQVTDRNEFYVTPVENGDIQMRKDEILKIYPEIGQFLEEITYTPFDNSELKLPKTKVLVTDMITENENDKYCFFKIPERLKVLYIQAGKFVTLDKSWEVMSKDLKKLYIDSTEKHNAFDKFSSPSLFHKIKSIPADYKSVDRRLRILGYENGLGDIFNKLMKLDFYPEERRSITKPYISIFKSRRDGKMGIFNKNTGSWLEKEGISYEPFYDEIDYDEYEDDEGNSYVVYVYSKSNDMDKDSFVVVSNMNDLVDGHFLSYSKWEQLKQKLHDKNEGNGEEEVSLAIDKDADEDLHEKDNN